MIKASITMKNIMLVLISLSVQTSFAQSEKEYAAKLYSGLTFTTTGHIRTQNSQGATLTLHKNLNFAFFSPAFVMFSDNGDFHELNIPQFSIGKNSYETIVITDTTTQTRLDLSIKYISSMVSFAYEYNIGIAKNKESRLQPYIGFSLSPYFSYFKSIPLVSNEFSKVNTNIGAAFFLIPRLNYRINEKWLLDFNIKGGTADIVLKTKKYEDPAIPTTSSIELLLFPINYIFRFGISYEI